MRYPGGVLIAILLLAIVAFTLTIRERPDYSPAIQGNSTLRRIVATKLDELSNRKVMWGWYCRSVGRPGDDSVANLNRIAPGHEFVRLSFGRRWWTHLRTESAPGISRSDLVIRLSDGQSRFVSDPQSKMESYPDFLIWARTRIQTEDDARVALAVVLNSRGISSASTRSIVACRDKAGEWQIGLGSDGCDEPKLTLITDQKGYVVGGTIHYWR
jgi:hypothetical protein